MRTSGTSFAIGAALLAAATMLCSGQGSGMAWAGTDVTTYHMDTLRTGWNDSESVLTPETVAGAGFGVLSQVTLDGQVDAQPLVVRNETIAGKGPREIVYIATEANTVYAIDADSGEIVLRANFGAPVPISLLPGKCQNNSNIVGISSTPVIDLVHRTLYVVTYTLEDGGPVYRLHALDLANLRDRRPSVEIKATVRATPGQPVVFDAATNRQRSALLLADGNVYVAFASFCDLKTNATRGWVLGWRQNSLRPLPSRPLVDRKAAGAHAWFMSSIWMSGSGPAADARGRIYVVTGNSDPAVPPTGEREMSESVVALSGDLRLVSEYFTPKNRDHLNAADLDFGSGGVMLLPDQPGPVPHLATADGKDGLLYLLDRDRMGGYTPNGPDKVVGIYDGGRCFCVQSYFTGIDGVNRLVTSGEANVKVWKIVTSPAVRLELEITSPTVHSGQMRGFMNMVSSNESAGAIIWAVAHPLESDPARTVMLQAFNATNGTRLADLPSGTWPNLTATANIMPVVANGKVFVASYRNLSIFGLKAPPKQVASGDAGITAAAPAD